MVCCKIKIDKMEWAWILKKWLGCSICKGIMAEYWTSNTPMQNHAKVIDQITHLAKARRVGFCLRVVEWQHLVLASSSKCATKCRCQWSCVLFVGTKYAQKHWPRQLFILHFSLSGTLLWMCLSTDKRWTEVSCSPVVEHKIGLVVFYRLFLITSCGRRCWPNFQKCAQ